MPDFVFAYHGGDAPSSPEEGARQRAGFMEWIGGLGDAVVDPGTPLGPSTFVDGTGVLADRGPEPMTGFSVVRADSISAAVDIALGSPFRDIGGTIQVAEIRAMPA